MALIIAIEHGTDETDPSTTFTKSEAGDNLSDLESCLVRIQEAQYPEYDIDDIIVWVDEILVIENDKVIQHFTWEDGLGDSMVEDDDDNTVSFDEDDDDDDDDIVGFDDEEDK